MTDHLSRESRWLLEEKYNGQATPEYEQDVERLRRGEPLAYVIGFVDFLGCRIDLSYRPLIPRAETEFWVEQAIGELKNTGGENLQCLDLFAGSGCIGLAVIKHLPNVTVDFADNDPRGLAQITINLEINHIERCRSRLIESDVFSGIKDRYDIIFANPPYLAESRKDQVQPSVIGYESPKALFAGTDGLDLIRRFLGQVKNHLQPGGRIYLEFDFPQRSAIEKLLRENGFADFEFHKDQFGRERWLSAAVR